MLGGRMVLGRNVIPTDWYAWRPTYTRLYTLVTRYDVVAADEIR